MFSTNLKVGAESVSITNAQAMQVVGCRKLSDVEKRFPKSACDQSIAFKNSAAFTRKPDGSYAIEGLPKLVDQVREWLRAGRKNLLKSQVVPTTAKRLEALKQANERLKDRQFNFT